MALTFDDAYAIIKHQGREIGQLVQRRDPLAMDVFTRYSDWYQHEGIYFERWVKRGAKGEGPKQDVRRRASVVAALETYLQRDLVEHEREELAGKKGHLVEVDKAIPDNIVQLEVKRAIRRGQ